MKRMCRSPMDILRWGDRSGDRAAMAWRSSVAKARPPAPERVCDESITS